MTKLSKRARALEIKALNYGVLPKEMREYRGIQRKIRLTEDKKRSRVN